MKCYYHPDKEAAAVCRACGRALCRACTADLDRAVVCRDRCEDDARNRLALLDMNARALQSMRLRSLLSPLFLTALGALFATFGLLRHQMNSFEILLGSCFLIYGLVSLITTHRFIRGLETRESPSRTAPGMASAPVECLVKHEEQDEIVP